MNTNKVDEYLLAIDISFDDTVPDQKDIVRTGGVVSNLVAESQASSQSVVLGGVSSSNGICES